MPGKPKKAAVAKPDEDQDPTSQKQPPRQNPHRECKNQGILTVDDIKGFSDSSQDSDFDPKKKDHSDNDDDDDDEEDEEMTDESDEEEEEEDPHEISDKEAPRTKRRKTDGEKR